MSSYYQLACTIVSLILNTLLIYLIIFKSNKQVGKYKYLMIYTALFEIFWGFFDFFADVRSYSHGYAFIVYRVNHPWTWLTDAQSTLVVIIHSGIFGASLAMFGVNFVYRYGKINKKFGKQVTSGWKFYVMFVVPLVFAVWYAVVVWVFFRRTSEADDYLRNAMWDNIHTHVEDTSSVSGLFYEPGATNRTLEKKWMTWIGMGNIVTITMISMLCVLFFGYCCYQELSKNVAELFSMSLSTESIQKQLFYSLVAQTAIPIVFMHIPVSIFFIFPILNEGFDWATNLLVYAITLYPAIDPLPNFFFIKSYRDALIGFFKKSTNLKAMVYQTRDAQVQQQQQQ